MIISKLTYESIDDSFIETISSFRTFDFTLEQTKHLFQSLPNNISIFIVKDWNKTIASGTILIEQKFIRDGGKVAHIEDIIVHPNYRNKGIGKILIEHLLNEAKKKGCYKAILDCEQEVTGFYEKLGFVKSSLHMRKDL